MENELDIDVSSIDGSDRTGIRSETVLSTIFLDGLTREERFLGESENDFALLEVAGFFRESENDFALLAVRGFLGDLANKEDHDLPSSVSF